VIPVASAKAAISASSTSAPAPGFAKITIPKRIETRPLTTSKALSPPSIGSQNAPPTRMIPVQERECPDPCPHKNRDTDDDAEQELASQPRLSLTVPLIAATRPTTPVAAVYAPNSLYQLFEANFGLFGASANGGGVAFFADVGGFDFGAIVAWVLTDVGRIAPQGDTAGLRAPA